MSRSVVDCGRPLPLSTKPGMADSFNLAPPPRCIDGVCSYHALSVCMRTITIDDEAYEILRRLKQGKGDSFTRVIKRSYQKLDTCGELIDWIESEPSPKINRQRLASFKENRGKRSHREF